MTINWSGPSTALVVAYERASNHENHQSEESGEILVVDAAVLVEVRASKWSLERPAFYWRARNGYINNPSRWMTRYDCTRLMVVPL